MDMTNLRREGAGEPAPGERRGPDRRRSRTIEPLLALCAGTRSVEMSAGNALRRLHPRLGATHACVLVQLSLMGGEACRSDLQARLAMPATSVGDALRALVAEGLVMRLRGADARRAPARLTPSGARSADAVRGELYKIALYVERTRRAGADGADPALVPYASGTALRSAARHLLADAESA